MPDPTPIRTWGFRLSPLDVIVLLFAPALAWWSWPSVGPIVAALPVALAHVFLFCNIFRIHRTKELWWSALFVINVASFAIGDRWSWPLIIAIQTPITAVCIVWEMRGPYDHGIHADRINRRLDESIAGTI